MFSEFKAFLLKTNALALAIAFILGVALAAVVNSLVADIIMPPVGLALGGVDFQNLFIDLSGKHYPTLAAAKEAGAATINYGVFLMTVITFIIVAFRGQSFVDAAGSLMSIRAMRKTTNATMMNVITVIRNTP